MQREIESKRPRKIPVSYQKDFLKIQADKNYRSGKGFYSRTISSGKSNDFIWLFKN